MKSISRKICLLLVVALLSTMVAACGGSNETYYCGYCGKSMNGGYYDYINGSYACRSCSKQLRH